LAINSLALFSIFIEIHILFASFHFFLTSVLGDGYDVMVIVDDSYHLQKLLCDFCGNDMYHLVGFSNYYDYYFYGEWYLYN